MPTVGPRAMQVCIYRYTPSLYFSMGIVLNCCRYGVVYLGSYYNTGPYINFHHSRNSNLGKLPYLSINLCFRSCDIRLLSS